MAIDASSPGHITKRRRTISHDLPQKRIRPSTKLISQNGYTTTSDVYELQVQELLENLESEAKANVQNVTGLLKQLKEGIDGLPPRKPLHPKEAEAHLKTSAGITIPFPVTPPKNAQYTLGFARPSAINVVGSTASQTLLSRNGQIVADLVVVMPAQIFQEKDYRKYRYFHKKAFYTACIVEGLQKANLDELSYAFSLQNGNPLQPCIMVRQRAVGESSIVVRIICVPPIDIFPQDKILPWMNSLPHDTTGSEEKQPIPTMTPFYNSTLRSEMLTLAYLSLIHKVNKDIPALRRSSLLFSIWLRQRGFGAELFEGGFGPFEAQALMAIMLHNDPASGIQAMFRTRYDHNQLFKATLILLASKDFSEDPALYNFSIQSARKTSAAQPLHSAQKNIINGTAGLFLDGARAHNLFFKMSPWACNRLQRQAEITVKCLSGSDPSRFDHCFISKLNNTITRYDQILLINVGKDSKSHNTSNETVERVYDNSSNLHKTLKQALGDRVHEISFSYDSPKDWSPQNSQPKARKSVQLNIVVDAKQAARLQDLGPSANEKDAAAVFRQFWGSKAELRRFRDGSIQETVVWDTEGPESIVTQIVRYAIQRHHGQEIAETIKEIGPSFWDQIPQPKQSRSLGIFEDILKAYQNLEKIIRDLKMPLAVRQISPASPGLRYSLLNIDGTGAHQPLQVVVQFESSGQWPDGLGAVQQVKIAFLQKLAELLPQHDNSIRTRVGLDQQANKQFHRPFLEVMFDCLCFHIVLYHDRELVLLRSSPVDTMEERKLVVPQIHYHNTTFLRAPAHTTRIRDLCTQYPLLSQAIRLLKSWFSAHLLLPHFREELIELFVVYVFTQSAPYGVPSSLRTAFLRSISMLAKWDWHNEPLMVQLSNDTDATIMGQLNTHFEAWRKVDPSLSRIALIVGSTLDPTGTAWTEQGPSKMIAARLSTLAKAAYLTVMKLDRELDPKPLFTHSTKDYDFVIHLNAKTLKLAGTDAPTVVDAYLRELKEVYRDYLVWFHSGFSQKIIAGLWNPTMESKKWKVNLGYSTVPLPSTVSDDDEEVPNIKRNTEAILNGIVRLGGDLVSQVTLKNEAA